MISSGDIFSSRLHYYRRLFSAYVTSHNSHLTFWHEVPEVNANSSATELGEYYMLFGSKALYSGPFDAAGIPLLDYHGRIGVQYNPIAIAQYGLGNFNLFKRSGDPERQRKFLSVADWLVANLELNVHGLWVWNHHFDWEYRTRLVAPWYSALAQGQGISLLVRAHAETQCDEYQEAAHRAFVAFLTRVEGGGVTYVDADGNSWLEEYIVDPPTHILNGFMWASWGIHDYFLATGDPKARALFDESVKTLAENLERYDAGFWSLYEQSGTRMKMLASPFYHNLHIVQLNVMHRLTGNQVFADYALRWAEDRKSSLKRFCAVVHKSAFKLCYY